MLSLKLHCSLFLVLIVCLNVLSQTIETPVIQYVTVDRTSQQPLIRWSINEPGLIDGYIIKRQIFNQPGVVDGSFNTIGTVNDRTIMEYLDNGTDYGYAIPGLRTETYRVAAFKMLGGNIEYSNMSTLHSTIHLLPVDFDLCHEQNSLIWTQYKGFGNNLGGYRVYYAETQTGIPTLIAELGNTDTTYVHPQVEANRPYFYFIAAYHNLSGDSSLSNVQSISTTMPPVPLIMNADYATVEQYDKVNLAFTVDPAASVSTYKLLKSKNIDGPWDSIASFSQGSSSINTSDFIKTNQETWYYKVIALNTCYIESRQSNLAHNIVLESWPDANLQFTNQISWQPYQTWLGGVENYKLFRSIDGSAFEEIAQLNASTLTYTDHVEQFVVPEINGQPSKGHFCYYIEATEGAGNPYGITGLSKSNISCAQQEAIVYIPNAFNPNSQVDENRLFKPVSTFVNDYSITIYNRAGEIVFQSKDPLSGWDGKVNGKLQPKATYVYHLKYRTKDNKLVQKSGQVNLVY